MQEKQKSFKIENYKNNKIDCKVEFNNLNGLVSMFLILNFWIFSITAFLNDYHFTI